MSKDNFSIAGTLLDCWQNSLAKYPEKDAIRDSHGKSYTYASANRLASSIAAYLLDCGVKKGDMVAVQMPGWAEFLPIYIACLMVGAAITPIPANLREFELTRMLDRTRAKALFLPRSYRNFTYCGMAGELCKVHDTLRVVVAIDKYNEGSSLPTLKQLLDEYKNHAFEPALADRASADDLAVIIFTSGSEGEAKGVMLSHRNVIAAELAFAQFFGIDEKDIMFMPAPPAHAIGFHHGITMPFIRGATSVLQDKFDAAEALELMEKHRATATMASTPFLHDIVNVLKDKVADISSLRFFLCGGSPPNLDRVREAGEKGIKVLNVYGATESVPHMGTRPDATPEQIMKQVLFPMPGITVRIVDKAGNEVADGVEGEQTSSSQAVFMGYLGMDDATSRALKNGWYHSGDLCRKNEDGSYSITGRLKDIIVRGGENISCLEVENILLQHPKISRAAVVGMPDERLQEKICACVVLEDPDSDISVEELAEHFNRLNVAKLKRPERVEIYSQFPRTHSGKLDKSTLAKDVAARMGAEK